MRGTTDWWQAVVWVNRERESWSMCTITEYFEVENYLEVFRAERVLLERKYFVTGVH